MHVVMWVIPKVVVQVVEEGVVSGRPPVQLVHGCQLLALNTQAHPVGGSRAATSPCYFSSLTVIAIRNNHCVRKHRTWNIGFSLSKLRTKNWSFPRWCERPLKAARFFLLFFSEEKETASNQWAVVGLATQTLVRLLYGCCCAGVSKRFYGTLSQNIIYMGKVKNWPFWCMVSIAVIYI